jgi:hypothetical protein
VHSLLTAALITAMPNSTRQPATTVLGVRLEPTVLRQVRQVADARQLTLSAATRQLLAVGLEQLQPTA